MIVSIATLFLFCLVLWGLKIQKGEGTSSRDLQSFRGLFALLIVLDHLSQELCSPGILRIFSYCGYIIVSLFFFMSGYGLSHSASTKPKYLERFLINRLPKLLVPFWLCNIIYIIIHTLFYGESITFPRIIGYILGYPQINSNGWYVISLFVMYISFYVSVRYITNGIISKSIVWIIVFTILWSVFCLVVIQKYWWMNACFAFSMGLVGYVYKEKLQGWNIRKSRIIVYIIFVALFYFSWFASNQNVRIGFMVLSSVCVCLVFFGVITNVKVQSKGLLFLGSISYEIYLIHNLFRKAFKSEIVSIDNDVVYLFVVLAISILSAVGIRKACVYILSWLSREKV